VFLEDYSIYLARHLVRGVDVWLNTPRRPNEASGTSGMKVCVNGGIHVSTLDGWWCEGYRPEAGWAIGNNEPYSDEEYHDTVESQALYNLLETEIIPTFYDRPAGDLPLRWIRMMKASMRMSLELFSSHRMVSDYMRVAYAPAMDAYDRLAKNRAEPVAQTVSRRRHIAERWHKVRVDAPVTDRDVSDVRVGDSFDVTVHVHLGDIQPQDVRVEVYYGDLDAFGNIVQSHTLEMELKENVADGHHVYRQTVQCGQTGRFGFTARVLPRGEEWRGLMPGYIAWADWRD
jgi:starch phosphorylase